ncbi:hypothetical protein ACFFQW_03045 [Umezawaea endophytica]|uniref:Uncharacterized protein n=1 Tax=Umezawaea endophytica TaxID=1654476 RepID=A0A9X2VN18_9PSEU|nr:hypothetical protein [Umezawaea endophytica]MCS7479124.1 hypothetical protein [Umezawaea endophytica]
MLNRLALEWQELKPAYRLRELTGNSPPRTIEQRQQQLIELLLAAEQEHASDVDQRIAVDARAATKALRGFDYVTMVKRAGDLTPGVGADLSETTWRMCSAFAHGDSSATTGLLSKDVVEQSAPGIKLVRTSIEVGLMVSASMIATKLTANAFRLLEHRRYSPFH